MKKYLFLLFTFLISCNEPPKPGCQINLVMEDCIVLQHGKFYREECHIRDTPTYTIRKDGLLVYVRKFAYSETEEAKKDVLRSKEDFCPGQDKGSK